MPHLICLQKLCYSFPLFISFFVCLWIAHSLPNPEILFFFSESQRSYLSRRSCDTSIPKCIPHPGLVSKSEVHPGRLTTVPSDLHLKDRREISPWKLKGDNNNSTQFGCKRGRLQSHLTSFPDFTTLRADFNLDLSGPNSKSTMIYHVGCLTLDIREPGFLVPFKKDHLLPLLHLKHFHLYLQGVTPFQADNSLVKFKRIELRNISCLGSRNG